MTFTVRVGGIIELRPHTGKGQTKAKHSLSIREGLAHPLPHQPPAKVGAGVVQHPQQTAPHPAVCLSAAQGEKKNMGVTLGWRPWAHQAQRALTWLLRISRFLRVAALSFIPSEAQDRRWNGLIGKKKIKNWKQRINKPPYTITTLWADTTLWSANFASWPRRCQGILARRTRNANTHKMFGKTHFGELEALAQTHLRCQTNGSDHENGG